MKPDIKSRWVSALRSGEYAQGRNYLRQIDHQDVPQFCCLGVLCDLAKQDGIATWSAPPEDADTDSDEDVIYYCDGEAELPPAAVYAWAGLDADAPHGTNQAGPFLLFADAPRPVTELNDGISPIGPGRQLSFDQIAQLIEDQL